MLESHRLLAYSFFDCFEASNEAVRKCMASEATLSDFKQNQPSQNQPDQGNHKKNCCICLFYHVLPPFRDAHVTLCLILRVVVVASSLPLPCLGTARTWLEAPKESKSLEKTGHRNFHSQALICSTEVVNLYQKVSSVKCRTASFSILASAPTKQTQWHVTCIKTLTQKLGISQNQK